MSKVATMVGTFGIFSERPDEKMVETWKALETLSCEAVWWAGIYNAWDLLDWAWAERLLTNDEVIAFRSVVM